VSFVLREVQFRYSPDGNAVLNRVSADIPAGGITAVLGMSGSGKTTLLNLLARLEDRFPTSGTIEFRSVRGAGVEYRDLTPRRARELRRDHFGFVLQSAYLLGHLDCADNIAVPLALQGVSYNDRRRRAIEVLREAEMEDFAGRSARDLSGGERQRIAVLRAVIHDPEVIFADEPFSSLDPYNTDLILALLKRWQSGELHTGKASGSRSLILVTHHLALALEFASLFLPLNEGEQLLDSRILVRADLPDDVNEVRKLVYPRHHSPNRTPHDA